MSVEAKVATAAAVVLAVAIATGMAVNMIGGALSAWETATKAREKTVQHCIWAHHSVKECASLR